MPNDTATPAEPIRVAKPTLPPRAQFDELIDTLYSTKWLTNNGPLVRRLESAIGDYLGCEHFSYVANGTQALEVCIRAYGLSGSIITTPFSYVATANAIALSGCEPVFADVDPDTLCLDPAGLAAALRPDTTAIMPVHVYGRPCDVDAIEAFAKTHDLRVIYDAAHAFGVRYRGRALMDYGDAAAVSFHATKVFHTVEGGGVVVQAAAAHERIGYLRAHGHAADDYRAVGLNAKGSELHAAVGLLGLPALAAAIERRRRVYEVYLAAFGDLPLEMFDPGSDPQLAYNYAYAPVRFGSAEQLLAVRSALEAHGVFARRYFWPALHTLPQFGAPQSCPVALAVSQRMLCLPLYAELDLDDAARIAGIVAEASVRCSP